MNSSLWRLDVQIAGESFCLIFNVLIFFLCFAIAVVKKRIGEMNFKSSTGSSHLISEKATSHVSRLKNTRSNGDRMREQYHKFWMSSSLVVALI